VLRYIVRSGFWSPPTFLPLSRGGGVQNRGCTSPTATIRVSGSTMDIGFWSPPAFLYLSGGGGGGGFRIEGAPLRWLRLECPDQRRIGNHTLLSRSSFNQCEAFPCHVTSQAATPPAAAHRILEPPRLSTFKRRGGPELRAHLSNGYD
jgi:hypothetical protein